MEPRIATHNLAAEYYVSAEEIASIPLAVLRDIERIAQKHPWRALDEEREVALRTRSWPTYVFAPQSVFIRAAIRAYGQLGDDQHALYFFNEFRVVAPWRVTRGIYCFDEALSSALADTSPATEIPINVLTRLPEWTVCLFGASLSPNASVICAFASIVFYDRNESAALNIVVVHPDGSRSATGIILTPGVTVEKGIAQAIEISRDFGGLENEVAAVTARLNEVTATVSSIVAHLLYLCAEDPDMEAPPPKPRPTKTKSGSRFFPLGQGSRVIPVGARVGAVFRRAKQAYAQAESSAKTGRTMPPHWRKPHWSHYWVGPRDASVRQQVLRWIAPTFVNATRGDVAVVVHPVR